VLANVRVLFGLVKTRLSHDGNGAAKATLVVARLGAAADRQGAVINRPGAANACQGVDIDCKGVINHRGIAIDCQGAAIDCQGTADCQGVIAGHRVPSSAVRVPLIL
jgi:hypothetical protein